MQQIISADDFGLRIGEQWERVTQLLRLSSINLRWIDADADHADSALVEVSKPLLETPQLGVAEWSPKTTIENQHDSSGAGKQVP